MSFRSVFIALVIGFGLVLAGFLINRQRPPAETDHPALFAEPPALSPSGKLTFRAADDSFGTAAVTVRLHDSGSTANGGQDTSAPVTFTSTRPTSTRSLRVGSFFKCRRELL